MPDGIPSSDDFQRDIELAYVSCVLQGIKSETGLVREYLRVKKVKAAGSLVNRVARAVPIPCIIDSLEFEEASQRFVIGFHADGSDRPEIVRSDRVDGRRGDEVRAMWPTSLVGGRALIYKTNENRSRDRPTGYRVAPYVIPLGH